MSDVKPVWPQGQLFDLRLEADDLVDFRAMRIRVTKTRIDRLAEQIQGRKNTHLTSS